MSRSTGSNSTGGKVPVDEASCMGKMGWFGDGG